MPQLSVRFPDASLPDLETRGDKAAVIRESLARYFSLLARARAGLRAALTEAEVSLLADASNGVIYESWSIPHLAAGIEDAIALDGADRKWGVDGPALLAKLAALDSAATFALVDALERFWAAAGRGEDVPPADILR